MNKLAVTFTNKLYHEVSSDNCSFMLKLAVMSLLFHHKNNHLFQLTTCFNNEFLHITNCVCVCVAAV